MINKLILKKALAKEVLLIFSALALTVLIWVFLLIQNSYYNNKAASLQKEMDLINFQIYSLPIKDSAYEEKLYSAFSKDYSDLQNSNRNIRSDEEIWKLLKWVLVILLIIIYPVRLSFLLLKWSIRTVKQKTT